MQVYIHNSQHSLSLDNSIIKKIVEEVIKKEGESCDEVSINFVTVQEITTLHDEHFQDPTPTDCISFPIDPPEEEYRLLGEIFVCPKVAMEYVAQYGGDPYHEVMLYLIHGLLHLMGYDDIADDERAKMRIAEQRHLDNLSKKGISLKAV